MEMQVNKDGLKFGIDMTGEKFGAKVSIAQLAINSFAGIDSDDLIIYHAQRIVDRHWAWELEDFEYEYGLSYTATFKDGSKLVVCAWRMEPVEDQWED